jgi:hypothetical protein
VKFVDDVVEEGDVVLPRDADGHVRVQDAEPYDDVGPEFPDLLLDLVPVRDEKGGVVEDRGTDERRTDDGDVPALYGLMVVVDHLSLGEEAITLMGPPPDLKVDDADLMAPLGETLHEVMTLVRPDFRPIGFLNDENSH